MLGKIIVFIFVIFIDVLIEWLDFINENKLGFAVIVTVPFTSSMGGAGGKPSVLC